MYGLEVAHYVTDELSRHNAQHVTKADIEAASAYILDAIRSANNAIMENPVSKPIIEDDIDKRSIIITSFDDHFGELIVREDPLTGTKETTYNYSIARKRMQERFDRAFTEIEIRGRDNFDEIIIAIGGDNVDGDGSVYPTQEHFIEPNGYIWTQMMQYSDALVDNAERAAAFLGEDKRVRIIGVAGNHGNSKVKRGNHPVKHNWDTGCYDMIQNRLYCKHRPPEYDRITISYSRDIDVKSFKAKGWTYTMIHAMTKNMGAPTFAKKLLGIKELYNPDVVLTGHYHESGLVNLGTTSVYRIGTSAGPNDYSDKLMIKSSGPEQSLFIVSAKYKVEAYIPIEL